MVVSTQPYLICIILRLKYFTFFWASKYIYIYMIKDQTTKLQGISTALESVHFLVYILFEL